MGKISNNFQILSLSGGGIRGLFSAEVLAKLEEVRDINILDHFDMICGTSIGGIVALGVACEIPPKEIAKILRTQGNVIFPPRKTFSKYSAFIRNLSGSNYSPSPLKTLLERIFEDRSMKDLKTRVLIPAVNYTTGQPKVFKTPHLVDYYNDLNISLVDVALATSAAPTYFPIHVIDDQQYVDGGLIGNSPAYFGLHEALYFLNQSPKDISVLSIGTMSTKKTSDHRKKLNQGIFHWARASIELTLSASESLHKYWVSHILPKDNFLVLDETLTNDQAPYISLDNAEDKALETLSARGKAVANFISNKPELNKFLQHYTTTPNFYEKGQVIQRGL